MILPVAVCGSSTSTKHTERLHGPVLVMVYRVQHLAALAASLFLTISTSQPAAARDVIAFRDGSYSAGTIVIRTSERRLYYVVGDGRAIRYPVGVGKAGKAWSGRVQIEGKYIRPAWSPPADVKRDKPHLPNVIAGGSSRNPMGAAAMTLSGGGQYAIHGTNVPGTVGGFVSYGCFRMYNQDVLDLYSRVSVGTSVVVTR